jgi:hypothetical protein
MSVTTEDEMEMTTETTSQTETPCRDAYLAAVAHREALEADDSIEAEDPRWLDAVRAEPEARDAYARSDEPRTYDLGDDGGWHETIECTPSEIEDHCRDFTREGSWGQDEVRATIFAHGYYRDTLTRETGSVRVCFPARVPPCADGHEHDWYEAGVVGNGGGVIVTEHCEHCGWAKTTDTWGQDRSTGEQGLRIVSYERRDGEEE